MPRPRSVPAEGKILVTFAEAARLLSCKVSDVTGLVAREKLREHPLLAGRIAVRELERFALESYDAQTDTASRRTVDALAPGKWDRSSLRNLREDRSRSA